MKVQNQYQVMMTGDVESVLLDGLSNQQNSLAEN